jgi:hypothetical protein
MSIIDRQRIAAVRELEKLGYSFTLSRGWTPPPDTTGTQAGSLRKKTYTPRVTLSQGCRRSVMRP